MRPGHTPVAAKVAVLLGEFSGWGLTRARPRVRATALSGRCGDPSKGKGRGIGCEELRPGHMHICACVCLCVHMSVHLYTWAQCIQNLQRPQRLI